jgi:hypothetical protein
MIEIDMAVTSRYAFENSLLERPLAFPGAGNRYRSRSLKRAFLFEGMTC